MDTPADDQSTQRQDASAEDSQTEETAADLKAKLHGDDESGPATMNHIGENGFASMNNHVAKHDQVKESTSQSHSSSSKSKDGHHSSSSSKPKDGHHSSSSSKHGSSKHKEGSSSSSKHKEGSSSSSKHKEGSSSSSSKHKEGSSSSSSKHKEGSSSSSSKHKEGSSSSSSKHKEGSSSSSSKHKEGSSSSSSKHKEGSSSSSSKPKEGHHSSSSSSSKPKEGHHSSSSSSNKPKEGHHSSSSSSGKHRDGSSSHSKDKHSSEQKAKDKTSSPQKEGEKRPSEGDHKVKVEQKDKSKESGHKDKHSGSSGEKREKHREEEKPRIKEEPGSPTKGSSPTKSGSPNKSFSPPMKAEPQSDDDVPLSNRVKPEKAVKRAAEDSDDDAPLSSRVEKAKKVKTEDVEPKVAKKRKNADESEDEKPLKKKKKKVKPEPSTSSSPTKAKGKAKKGDEKQEVWKWWEEERRDDGVKWTFLEHKGPLCAPEYEVLPSNVHFYYNGKKMRLSKKAEEVGTFYARMLDHDYTTRDVFNNNYMRDWRKQMTSEEKQLITDIKLCNFKEIADHFKQKTEERKAMTKEEKLVIKKQNEEILKEYGFCKMDGHVEKIGNFKIEPPGLFRGRGDHPKQGMLKTRTLPEDVMINCSKDAKVPTPPEGHKWKEVRHDNTVSWLACWQENVQGQTKYVMLNAASRLKGEKDWQKYEVARKLHKCVDKIRATYRQDLKSKEMRIRQRAVALYFIDKLALRAGNEKESDETADTVGCCSLRVEHLTLHEEMDGQEFVVEFDFLGKDSIRYYNKVSVDKRVYKNVELFMENKQPEDDVFDRLNTTILNKHLQVLMEGLTAKVFRTFNASRTLQEQLDLLTNADDPVAAKLLSYNRANRAVAILCNHQRAVPKNFDKQMENLQNKIIEKKQTIKDAKKQMKDAKSDLRANKSQSKKSIYDKKKKAVERLEEQLTKLEVQATDKDENKEIALGTSKLNYLDPRISVAWCKKFEVPIEKIYNKTQRDKFRWAIDMAGPEFVF